MAASCLLRHLAALLTAASLAAACGGDAPRAENNEIVEVDLPVVVEAAFGGRVFDRPVEVGAYPGGRMFVAEQPGTVQVLKADGSDATTLLDIGHLVEVESGEGLLSFALDPGFEGNGYVWAYYYASEPARSVLSRFKVEDGAADAGSGLIVLSLRQPGTNQNGGAIRFGPEDGMLYLGLGDGSASFDPFENGQDPGTLLGSIVRLDVRNATPEQPYTVPADNPFVDRDGFRPEIWAWGVRNPWRMAFDAETGKLWGGDVMSGRGEEVNVYERGGNYGWNDQEGFRCVSDDGCEGRGFTRPVAAYDHEEGRCAVTGGVVYRGSTVPRLQGLYVFADFCTGELFALDAGDPDAIQRIGRVGDGQVTSFGTDAADEVYVTAYDGRVWRLAARQ